MGGDGGSIPGRADMVRTAGYRFVRNLGGMGYNPNTQVRAGDEKFNRTTERSIRWRTCAISQEPLARPFVACRLGNLYNKECLITRLLSKTLPVNAMHIRSLKDIRDCKVVLNEKTNCIMCPIACVDLDGGIKGQIIWTCGCVLSERATKNVPATQGSDSDSPNCLSCGEPYVKEDVIPLIPDDDELIELKNRLEQWNSRTIVATTSKASKKRKRQKEGE